MDSIEKNTGYVPEISNNSPEIIEPSDKTSSLTLSSDNLDSRNLANNNKDGADHTNTKGVGLSCIKSTISVGDQSDSNDNLHANGNTEGDGFSSINLVVSDSDQVDSNDNLHANGNTEGVSLSNIKSTASASDQLDSNDNLPSSGKPESVDLCSIYPAVSVSDNSDNDCTSILIFNGKVNNLDKLCEAPNALVPSGEFDSYDNSKRTSQELDAPMEITKICVVSNKSENSLLSTDKPGNCDFSSDEPWNETFPKRKSRRSGFFSDNIWGSNLSSNNPVSCDFSSDNFSSAEDGGSFSIRARSDDFSSLKKGCDGFSNDKPETCDLTSNIPWNANFSNDKTVMPVSIKVSSEKPIDSKHSNNLLGGNVDTPSAMPKTSSKLGDNSNILNGTSCSTPKESKNTDMSCEELDNSAASSNCFENPMRSSKDFDVAESFAIETPVLPNYLIETSGILGNDPSECRAEKEINDIYISSFKYPDYESRETFENEYEVTAADGNWKIEKCHQSAVLVLKRIDEHAQYKFKCIYFNKGTKLDELFKHRSHDDLNVSQEEIFECIDSMKDDQLNFIADPVESNNQSGFLEDRMGTSEELTEDLDDDHEQVHKKIKEHINSIVEKMLNEEFYAMTKNEENFDMDLDIKSLEKEMAENANLDEVESILIHNQNYSNKLGAILENANHNEQIGSQVQDISGYLSSTETVNETTNTRIESNELPIQQRILNCVKIVWDSVFSAMLGYFSYFSYFFPKSQSLTLTECAATQTISEAVADVVDFPSETNFINRSSTSNTKTVSSKKLERKTRITNFSTLFHHLSATVGTDMTAERAMKDINSQVVMDIYNGFHELRIVDYGSLDLMSKCIRGGIVTLQRTLSQSDPIVFKASALLRKKTHTVEEMREMNEDLKNLTSVAEAHLHSIERALTGLEDFTDDFMYYKNAISKELIEFLQEDFPEIFK